MFEFFFPSIIDFQLTCRLFVRSFDSSVKTPQNSKHFLSPFVISSVFVWRLSAITLVSLHFLKPIIPYILFFRTAAVARKVYLRPGRGVGGLSKAFGTKARRGTMTNIHKPAATGIIRHVLQQLEALKVRGDTASN